MRTRLRMLRAMSRSFAELDLIGRLKHSLMDGFELAMKLL